ncbi:Hypothetical Protein FCC1311_050372 [Hondaea fermentalgiana]|uniref:Ras guanine nucleotide exchange factor glfB-like C-terminal domain-containing protein n=1 Tax=Hondaea fermentalgiana TaxID=2315210 RepID=A0A2R5GCW9_9STRA|nr:Hypothetical Protein FCC1311_050372 [Hondaea fermentalgiana]|eukprot:GBG28816.1 Hypothetical Protein FCC1311_050372 [Hondaea fermentalgiana]
MSLFSVLLNELRKATVVVDDDAKKRSNSGNEATADPLEGDVMDSIEELEEHRDGDIDLDNEAEGGLDDIAEDDEDEDDDDDASDLTHNTKVRDKMMGGAKIARDAATQVWSRTKITRLKFPSSSGKSTMPRVRKTSFMMSSRNTSRTKLDAVLGSDDSTSEAVIYDSMNEMWQDDVFNLPVCKDLPRLVRRVCVLDHNDEILYLAPGASNPASTHLAMKPAVDASESIDGEEVIPDSADSAFGAPEDSSTSGVDAETEARRNSRLARWSLRRKKDGRSSIKANELSSNASVVRLIVDLIVVLLAYLEPDEDVQAAVIEEVREIQASVTEASDLQLVVRQIIEAVGVDSKVTKVLKCIHQNVVLQSTVAIKEKLTMQFPTKDVRSSDGWRITITLSKGFAQVRHTRREQSIDSFGNIENHWEFEWELRMTFDQQMQNMTAAQLRVTRLMLSETMDVGLAARLKATLVDGLIVM